MSKTKRTSIDQALCDHARLLMAGGAKAPEAAEILGIGVSTLYRMKAAGYSAEAYLQNTEKERQKQMNYEMREVSATYTGTDAQAEEQLPGQMRMELPEVKEETKQMRFQAAMVDRLVSELDKINDTLNMMIRVLRKE